MKLEYTKHFSISDRYNKDEVFNIDQTRIDSFNKKLLVSHAHSDHIVNTPQLTYATKPTQDFINLQLPNNKLDFIDLNNNKEIYLTNRIKLTPLNAGHILGSNMFYLENENTSLLYSGDLQIRNSLLLKGAKAIPADTLIIESTFGRDNFKFPKREKIYYEFAEDLSKDIINNRLILIGAYKLGKSQEIIKFINTYLKEIPLVNESIYNNCKIYEKYNLNIGKYKLLNGNLDSANILILPPNLITRNLINTLEHQTNRSISTYFITGWSFYKKGKCIPISDHADFYDLLEFVSLVKPKKIITMHGFYRSFSKNLKKYFKNINIKNIDDFSKKNIFDFL